jgi:hypothetical protein
MDTEIDATTDDWRWKRVVHRRAEVSSALHRQWMAFMVRLNLSWYEHWRISLFDGMTEDTEDNERGR